MTEEPPESSKKKAGWADQPITLVEDLIYALVALLLTAGALVVLVNGGYKLVTKMSDGVDKAVEETLDALLLVFILVELISAVRETMRQRKLIAEPFLLVGMIAAIKEIVLNVITVKEQLGKPGDKLEDTMLTVGVLGGVLLVLGITTFMLRRKEREPEE